MNLTKVWKTKVIYIYIMRLCICFSFCIMMHSLLFPSPYVFLLSDLVRECIRTKPKFRAHYAYWTASSLRNDPSMMTYALENGVDLDNVLSRIDEDTDDDDISSCFRSQRFHDFIASSYVGKPRIHALQTAKEAKRLSCQATRAREVAQKAAREADSIERKAMEASVEAKEADIAAKEADALRGGDLSRSVEDLSEWFQTMPPKEPASGYYLDGLGCDRKVRESKCYGDGECECRECSGCPEPENYYEWFQDPWHPPRSRSSNLSHSPVSSSDEDEVSYKESLEREKLREKLRKRREEIKREEESKNKVTKKEPTLDRLYKQTEEGDRYGLSICRPGSQYTVNEILSRQGCSKHERRFYILQERRKKREEIKKRREAKRKKNKQMNRDE